MNLLALHGFLGTGRDWNFLRDHFKSHPTLRSWSVENPDLFSSPPTQDSLEGEARKMADALRAEPDVLLGYSYGGRLALEMLLLDGGAHPKLKNCKKLVLCSSGFGILDPEKREARRQSDEQWARDFISMPWAKLLEKWSAQEVLKTSAAEWPGPRDEALFNRARLAEALVLRSPAQGKPALERIGVLKLPILLMVGEADLPYVAASQELLRRFPQVKVLTVPAASHRLPWQKPGIFLKAVEEFLFT